ncbi:DUF488 domain-containing protein [Stutzerimonas degradans]|uniref:DUF488 domain-containing protein n=1 Tax=Stutzerimonas degradans TaxID=2968968 RepID=A0A8E2U2P0_9GAMM|nr:DUF488 domain-containing protein [Stutzerimonas degradans]MCQ4277110.1 DUF488 domain-containing protein [Stutzerimonas degradans]PNF75268.1 hypothetical protein CXK95_16805 [Stutzerimonas degradans]QPT22183.1 DUF488 domain-containing protein [Stutzerimonas degradans]
MSMPDTVWTIGHSTRSLEQFIALLEHYRIEGIADVRRHPGSRRLPQFGSDALREALADRGINYEWLPELGGRRRAAAGSVNQAWRNASFRGYADHLASAEFARGLERLLALAGKRHTAMMCAEVLWWRCHRSLVSDVLKVRGIEVLHIQDEQHLIAHPFTAPARLVDGELSYAQDAGEPLRQDADGGRQARLDI